MKLTRHTDYALRVMIHLAARPHDLASIRQIAATYDISQNHLMKIVQGLGQAGFVQTVRGRNGGIRLARPADQIVLGALIRHSEGHIRLVDCRDCRLTPGCGLPSILAEATEAFLAVLDRYLLSDITAAPDRLMELLGMVPNSLPAPS